MTRKTSKLVLAGLLLASAASATANTASDHDNTRDNFFRCAQNQNIWRAIATGHFPFWCW